MSVSIRAGLVCFLCLATWSAPRAAEFTVLAVTGEQAPGMPNGVTYSWLYRPVLNDAGQFAFVGELEGNGISATNDSALFMGDPNSIAPVAREGDPAPGTAEGIRYGSFEGSKQKIGKSSLGKFVFSASLQGPGLTYDDTGMWSGNNGAVSLVARTGDVAPGLPGNARFVALDDALMDAAGNVAFMAVTSEGGVRQEPYVRGIWGGSPSALAAVAYDGAPVPGMPSEYKFGTLYFDSLVMGAGGQIGIRADVFSMEDSHGGIWSGEPGALQLIAHAGSPAPGTEAGTTYGFFGDNPINALGQTTFAAYVVGPSVNATNPWGLWSDASGSPQIIVRSGEHAPGTPDGVNFNGEFVPVPRTNSAGTTMFVGTLAGPGVVQHVNHFGIWSNAFGPLSLVARFGEPMPGTPDGSYLEDFDAAMMNELGQTAFVGWLDGLPTDHRGNTGVWAQDSSGTLQLIARAGELLEVRPGDFREIDVVNLAGINDFGQIALIARMVDGSQVNFLSNKVAVPEPAIVALLLPVVALASGWRRGRAEE